MKKNIAIVGLLMCLNLGLSANEMENIDKLDVLDKQSKEFFKAITGLEKDYLEEQITNIESKKNQAIPNNTTPIVNQRGNVVPAVPEITKEETEKNIFQHQNDIARLTSDFTRTKQLKDIRIKSMYSFNGKDYVVLRLDNEKAQSAGELTSSIEGRYSNGDYILGHRITSVNVRTKSIKLYKKLDEEYGYNIYISNYGISVGDLIKYDKEEEKEDKKPKVTEKKSSKVKDAFAKLAKTSTSVNRAEVKEQKVLSDKCLYTVNVSNLNVRNESKLDATILRILRQNDQFTIVKKTDDWVLLDTIYKKKSGDVMPVDDKNNWVNITSDNVQATDESCI